MAGAIKRMRFSIPKDYYRTIYSALFESHLNYGIIIWGGVSGSLVSNLFVLQKYCIRILFGDLEAYLEKFLRAPEPESLEGRFLALHFMPRSTPNHYLIAIN